MPKILRTMKISIPIMYVFDTYQKNQMTKFVGSGIAKLLPPTPTHASAYDRFTLFYRGIEI